MMSVHASRTGTGLRRSAHSIILHRNKNWRERIRACDIRVPLMSVSRFITQVRRQRRERKIYRETIGRLSKLSNAQLEDIGIARWEIAERARG
ncbi:DUF1127 domain-containing protein [Methylobacterium sp. Leaf456]|uniref:DUF1127 domain-containing protein n=1 Tax=Methylobacterium sp. Leaf456 TaxID=1736382 RepID=UPI0009EA12E9